MLEILENPRRAGLPCPAAPLPSADSSAPQALLARCPKHKETPLLQTAFANSPAQFFVKDERRRMGTGSFKALGAAYVIAARAQQSPQRGVTYIAASAGNHGLSVAAGAAAFGARAVVVLAKTVPPAFAAQLREAGAEARTIGETYEESMAAAAALAAENGWVLLSDSSWAGYYDIPRQVMQGYAVLAAEAVRQMPAAPTDIFLQAGVGGLAAACAATFRAAWGNASRIVVAEPAAAPALYCSVAAGWAVVAEPRGGASAPSSMGRLDCKEPSHIALNGLARDADAFVLAADAAVEGLLPALAAAGCETTPSGGAGIAAAMLADLREDARVLCILSEGAL